MIVYTGYFDTHIPYYIFKVIIHKQQFYRILGTSLSTCIIVYMYCFFVQTCCASLLFHFNSHVMFAEGLELALTNPDSRMITIPLR